MFRQRVEHLGENTVSELLTALVTPARREQIDSHIAACGSCRRLVSALLQRSATAPVFAAGSVGEGVTRTYEPGTLVGRYKLGARLGSGAAGTVMRAHDPELDRTVALKLLHSGTSQRKRIQREARALAKLAHPNVVAVHDAGSEDGELFVAMELVDGTDLRGWLATRRSVPEVLRTFQQIGDGLAAAHAAGIIHRDVKPENILVGNDHRVRVGDFGLAGGPEGELEFIGTPAYMAPEQFDDGVASEATDQFAYCVALYEALYGKRPFSINLPEEVAPGLPKDPRAGVPSVVRSVLVRGLAVDPTRRYPSMTELVAALRPRRGKRVIVGAALAAVVIGGTGFALARIGGAPPPSCRAFIDEHDTVWTPARAAALHTHVLATKVPYAEDAWLTAERAFSKFDTDYRASRLDACEATRVQGVQSEQLLDVRMQCLDQARVEVAATLELLVDAQPATLATLAATVDALPTLDACANPTALLAPVPPPTAAERTAAAAIGLDVARAAALGDAGRWREAVAAATLIVARASTLTHASTRAHAQFLLGRARSGAGDASAAEAALREAYASAEVGHDDLLAARAAVELVWVVGQSQSRYRDGREWAFHAQTLLARAGGDAILEARLAANEGHIAFSSSEWKVALAKYQHALDVRIRVEGADSRGAAMALGNVARALVGIGDNAAAEAASRQALVALERALGPLHPDLAMVVSGLGAIEQNRGEFEAALASFDRALAISEPSLGPDHPQVGEALISRGYVLTALGRFDEAITSLDRAIAIFDRPGANRDHLEAALAGKGDVQAAQEHVTDALATYERALAVAVELDPANDITANATESCASAKLQLGRAAEALADYTRALAIREAVEGPDYFENAYAHAGRGDALVVLGRFDDAVVAYRSAVRLFDAYDGDPITRATTRFELAKALSRSHPNAAELATLLAASEHELLAAGELGAEPLAKLRAWHPKR